MSGIILSTFSCHSYYSHLTVVTQDDYDPLRKQRYNISFLLSLSRVFPPSCLYQYLRGSFSHSSFNYCISDIFCRLFFLSGNIFNQPRYRIKFQRYFIYHHFYCRISSITRHHNHFFQIIKSRTICKTRIHKYCTLI